MRDTLLKEFHDGPLVGHGGEKRTTTFLKKSYYWPNLKDCVEEYVKTCLTCQQNRTFNKKQVGLLQPLPIPEGPWEGVSMDFIVSLPPSKGFDAIMAVEDEYCIPPPNRWTNREGQLGDRTILEELCGGGLTRLGGPFGVSRVLLQ
jgi:hypothetical protein